MLRKTAVIFFLLAVAAYGQKVKRVTATQTSKIDGAEMFRTYCSPCHGLQGKGDGPAAAALKKQPIDLTTLSKENGGKFPGERVSRVLEEFGTPAHGSRDMPIWGDVFRAMEHEPAGVRIRVVNLTKYVESLQR